MDSPGEKDVTDAELAEILGEAVKRMDGQADNEDSGDQGEMGKTALGVTVDQVSQALKTVLSKNNLVLTKTEGDVILMSRYEEDRHYLSQLTSRLLLVTSAKGEFMYCTNQTKPEVIQEKLTTMQPCEYGRVKIIVAYGAATRPLCDALEESKFRGFLQKKGMVGKELEQKLQGVRKNLAVIALRPWRHCKQDSAKISINIELSREKTEDVGKLHTEMQELGHLVNEIKFHGKWGGLDLAEFINNDRMCDFIQETLLKAEKTKKSCRIQ